MVNFLLSHSFKHVGQLRCQVMLERRGVNATNEATKQHLTYGPHLTSPYSQRDPCVQASYDIVPAVVQLIALLTVWRHGHHSKPCEALSSSQAIAVLTVEIPNVLNVQVVQGLTYMGIWLRIPLVHPEAMDPDLNTTSIEQQNEETRAPSSTLSRVLDSDIWTRTYSDNVDNLAHTVAKVNVDCSDVNMEGCKGDQNGETAASDIAVRKGGELGGGGGGIRVEDPWETWNTVRMLCEHKTGCVSCPILFYPIRYLSPSEELGNKKLELRFVSNI